MLNEKDIKPTWQFVAPGGTADEDDEDDEAVPTHRGPQRHAALEPVSEEDALEDLEEAMLDGPEVMRVSLKLCGAS